MTDYSNDIEIEIETGLSAIEETALYLFCAFLCFVWRQQ